MSSLFEDLKEGLEEAIAYEKGYGEGRVKTYMILPVKEYSGKEIRDIRTKAGMTQSVFASYMGVSIKTVEAWEGGRTHPTGPVFRLLDILSKNEEMEYIVANKSNTRKETTTISTVNVSLFVNLSIILSTKGFSHLIKKIARIPQNKEYIREILPFKLNLK